MTHTPTPWKTAHDQCVEVEVVGHTDGITWGLKPIKHDMDEACFVYENDGANAALIVRAVNNHAALVEALEGLLTNAPAPKGIKQDYSYILHLEQARAALERAKL